MTTTQRKKTVICSGLAILLSIGGAVAQTPTDVTGKLNFGYSQNPKTKPRTGGTTSQSPDARQSSENSPIPADENAAPRETIAQKTLEVVKTLNKKVPAPTEDYKVGAGDILFINLQNSSKGSTLFTVLDDGTIDYPLAGEMVAVGGLSTDEIEEILREKIKLYENPQVGVKVREYASHKITVLGAVEKAGEKYIQREAVPLFVVRAEAVVRPNAGRVVIRRADSRTENYRLKDEAADNTLIFPNDIVEFAADEPAAAETGGGRFFFIGGEVASVGQKNFYAGLTLTQAILASGGLRRESVKKVIVRRKNAAGLLASTEFNLKQIKDGKSPDPALEAGDTIEVGN